MENVDTSVFIWGSIAAIILWRVLVYLITGNRKLSSRGEDGRP